ncbi:acyltransferase family protein [Polaribacter sp. HaHaR_3_91]|uniref:acyltransferase family protein n=1 Tax=Polaribacter sp. HaHaR_3_91 TaxID=2745561 RepID=UPI001C4F2EA1|nr:acyltransferase family protein [Polaribacter sp. HaHaR_3_91]
MFFLIASVFHPKKSYFEIVKKRVQQLLIPYFLWSFMFFLFWLFLGRKYGESAALELSPVKNFMSVFYAQGDVEYMNWGIPMWFLPSIFLTFLIFWLIKKIIQNKKVKFLIIIISVFMGFLIPRFTNIKLFWSLDVSLIFYTFGYYTKNYLFFNNWKGEKISLFILGILHLIFSLFLLQEVDMYRFKYGNEFLFIINALVGVLFWCNFYKVLPIFKF